MCRDCDWEDLLEDIDDMLDQDKYEFAVDTLEGIQEWVTEKEHCTEGQQNAVTNIQSGTER